MPERKYFYLIFIKIYKNIFFQSFWYQLLFPLTNLASSALYTHSLKTSWTYCLLKRVWLPRGGRREQGKEEQSLVLPKMVLQKKRCVGDERTRIAAPKNTARAPTAKHRLHKAKKKKKKKMLCTEKLWKGNCTRVSEESKTEGVGKFFESNHCSTGIKRMAQLRPTRLCSRV